MTSRVGRAAAIGLAVVTGTATAALLWRMVSDGRLATASDLLVQAGFLSFIGGFAVVGLVLTLHRPGNAVGWLMGAMAASLALRSACEEYAVHAFGDGALGTARWAAAVVNALEPVWLTALVGLAVVFPHGRIPGTRWRRAMVVVVVLAAVMIPLAPFVSYEGDSVTIPSLLGNGAIGGGALFPLAVPAWLLVFASMIRIIRLLFRGSDVERRQIGGVAFVLAVVLALLGLAGIGAGAADVAGIVAGIGIPTALAVGVTRYRLYEIDRLISRTLTFAIVIGALGLLYAVVAVMPFALVVGVGEGGEGAPTSVVAGATLMAASLFRPLYRRTRSGVEKRFNRSRYDAERVTEGFASAVGELTDARLIGSGLAAVAHDALRPSGVAVWLARTDPATTE